MVAWHHRLNGHECEQALGVGDGQGGLACCGPWGGKESDTTERLNRNSSVVYNFQFPIYKEMILRTPKQTGVNADGMYLSRNTCAKYIKK